MTVNVVESKYDEFGNVTSEILHEYDESGVFQKKFEINYWYSNGIINYKLMDEYDSSGIKLSYTNYSYDEYGNLSQTGYTQMNPDGTPNNSICTWPNGNMIMKVSYEYDSNGNKTFDTYSTYDVNTGALIGKEVYEYMPDYNVSYHMKSVTVYDGNNVPISQSVNNWNANGTLGSSVVIDGSGNITSQVLLEYNSNGMVTSEKTYEYVNNPGITLKTYKYSPEGQMISQAESTMNLDGSLIQKTVYRFDSENRITGYELYREDGTIHKTSSTYNEYGVVLGSKDFDYDASGNLVNKTLTAFNSDGSLKERLTYNYNVEFKTSTFDKETFAENQDLLTWKHVEYDSKGKIINDSTQSSISYKLDPGLKNLNLIGEADINGTGNWRDNVICGNYGNNILSGGAGNDTLVGLAGDDTLIGDSGNDTIKGSEGINIINGGSGNDLYVYEGAGIDKVIGLNSVLAGKDTLEISTSDISKENIAILKSGKDLLVGADDEHCVIFKDIFNGNSTKLNSKFGLAQIKLDDGTFLSNADINRIVQQITVFDSKHSEIEITSLNDVKSNSELMTMVSNSWHS